MRNLPLHLICAGLAAGALLYPCSGLAGDSASPASNQTPDLIPGIEPPKSDSPEALNYFERARTFEMSGRLDSAAEYLEKAIKADSKFADAWLLLGRIRAMQKNNPEAIRVLQNGIEAAPDKAELYLVLGMLYDMEGNHSAARLIYRKGLARQKDYFELIVELADTELMLGHVKESIELHQRAVELQPWNPDPKINLGYALMRGKKFDEAIESLRNAILLEKRTGRLGKSAAAAYAHLGDCYGAKKDYKKALDAYRMSLKLDDKQGRVYYHMGLLLAATGQYDTAETAFEKAIMLDYRDPAVLASLGSLELRREDYDNALAHFERALVEAPDYFRAHYSIALIRIAREQWAEAETSLKEALRIQPEDPNAMASMIDVLRKLDRKAEADVLEKKYLLLKGAKGPPPPRPTPGGKKPTP
ncbi:MAG: Beta-barrel assembly-enhancing protease [Myxococcota bacterium]|nr:Beta-barrel assembly-enhancing protease [Myxococcota bacterium]